MLKRLTRSTANLATEQSCPASPALTVLRAALLTGGLLEITEPGESEDFGKEWNDPAALTDYGSREPTVTSRDLQRTVSVQAQLDEPHVVAVAEERLGVGAHERGVEVRHHR